MKGEKGKLLVPYCNIYYHYIMYTLIIEGSFCNAHDVTYLIEGSLLINHLKKSIKLPIHCKNS